jgi:hypothetical protein
MAIFIFIPAFIGGYFLYEDMFACTACKVFFEKLGKPVMPELAQPLQ